MDRSKKRRGPGRPSRQAHTARSATRARKLLDTQAGKGPPLKDCLHPGQRDPLEGLVLVRQERRRLLSQAVLRDFSHEGFHHVREIAERLAPRVAARLR